MKRLECKGICEGSRGRDAGWGGAGWKGPWDGLAELAWDLLPTQPSSPLRDSPGFSLYLLPDIYTQQRPPGLQEH